MHVGVAGIGLYIPEHYMTAAAWQSDDCAEDVIAPSLALAEADCGAGRNDKLYGDDGCKSRTR